MKVSEEFPSFYLSGDEVNGHDVPVTIQKVVKEEVPTRPGKPAEEVLAVYFEGKKRGMRLNRTRAKEIRGITGLDDMDQWAGQKIVLYTEKQKAFGDIHNVLHCKATSGGDLPTINVEEEIDVDEIVKNIPV
jgi:hypothetical protein